MTVSDTSPPAASAPAPDAPRSRNTVGLIALSVAILAIILAAVPPTSFIAWLPALAAIILAIVALTRKGQKKGAAIAAIIIGPVAWIIAIVVATSSALLAVGTAIEEADTAPSIAAEPDSTAPADESAGETDAAPVEEEASIGDTVTTADGVGFTVSAITCGIPTAGPEFLVETAVGQFCEIRLNLANGSNEAVSLFSSDFTAFIGKAEYEANSIASTFGTDSFTTDVNPGLAVDGVVYIDIPAGAALEYVKYNPVFNFFDEGIIVRAS